MEMFFICSRGTDRWLLLGYCENIHLLEAKASDIGEDIEEFFCWYSRLHIATTAPGVNIDSIHNNCMCVYV